MKQLKRCFSRNFLSTETCECVSLQTSKQGTTESVDDFVDRVVRTARKIDMTEEQVCFCISNGFKPSIKKALAGKDLKTVDQLLHAARTTELVEAELDEDSPRAIATELKKMMSEFLSTKARQVARSPSPTPKTVRFTNDALSQSSIGTDGPLPPQHYTSQYPQQPNSYLPFNRGQPSWRRGFGGTYSNARGTQNSRGARGGYSGYQNQSYPLGPQQLFAQDFNNPAYRPIVWYSTGTTPELTSTVCRNCGHVRHASMSDCPANAVICRGCGKMGHFQRVCCSSGATQRGTF